MLSFESGKLGRLADSSVVARLGDTMLYSTVCYNRDGSDILNIASQLPSYRLRLQTDVSPILKTKNAIAGSSHSSVLPSFSSSTSLPSSVSLDFSPLRVDYFSRFSAIGETSSNYHRRDGRGGEESEILLSRLIDRPIRTTLFEGWFSEIQILTWLLSYDKVNSNEALAINCASAALALSEVMPSVCLFSLCNFSLLFCFYLLSSLVDSCEIIGCGS
jgi:polyribonucleotide nucleotidyltransferase